MSSLSAEQQLAIAFGRYKWIAWLTGAVLAFLTIVAIPYKYVFQGPGEWTHYAWMAHGWLYIVYFLLTLDLGLKAKWPILKLLMIELAGTVPFMSFVAERRVRRELGL